MLAQVDHPVLIRSSEAFSDLKDRIPGLMITKQAGPEGWNRAVLEIVGEIISGGIS
jgi:hypothetical protein